MTLAKSLWCRQAAWIILGLIQICMLCSCASNKAGMKSPELPARHWLDEAPGVPVSKKAEMDAAVPNLYDAEKIFNFDECVYLAIQQSPLLVNSAVELELKRLALTNAIWNYIPEPRMSVRVSNNLTQYNMNTPNTPSDYGQTKMQLSFYAALPNPIATYFDHQVQKLLVNMAISTHRKAIGEAIHNIAASYLKLQAQRKKLEMQKELLPIAREKAAYWKQVEAVDGRQGVALNVANQHVRETELIIEQTNMQEVMERTRLKIQAGVDPSHRLEINTDSADSILSGFDGYALRWDERWPVTENDFLMRGQIKLGDYKIMVAWAKYIPDMTLQINSYPPSGQYQPPDGQEDQFLHLNFDFPLIDWGSRYRGVQSARMSKAKAFNEMARKRTEYSNSWLVAEQAVALSKNQMLIAQNSLETARMQYEAARISYDEGTAELPELCDKQETLVQARLSFLDAELRYKLALLDWMYLANVLQERFIGLPAKELS